MNKTLTEFVGTFLFLLVIAMSGVLGGAAPMAIGFALAAMVYMGGHISGAHYNPAVTLACAMRGKMDSKDIGPYLAAQFVAAGLAFFVGHWLTGSAAPMLAADAINIPKALFVEFIFTFMLAIVVLNVATAKGTAGNSFYGLAIGITVMVAAWVGGGISGGAYNPAVGFGATMSSAIWGGGSWSTIWIHLLGPFAGGAAAAAMFRVLSPDEE